ncbi:hypothetical protein ECDEC5D_0132 [Escherichia coli DEC5D]|nr:hypothetical protein ECDEC5D_0132 [Escherichia coli DEC5D]
MFFIKKSFIKISLTKILTGTLLNSDSTLLNILCIKYVFLDCLS